MRTRKPFNAKPTSTEDGFAIPIALGFGLIMILLATTSVIRSQNDNISAINKRSTARSLAAAETGISRVQDFLNRNRSASAAQACAAAPATYGVCPDVSPTISWDVPTTIPNLCSSAYTSADAALVDNNNWQNVSSTDADQGQFRISSYTTAGVLTVEGRANVGTSGEAKSKVQVTLPITYPTSDPVASLWVNATTSQITGTPQVDSSVVINSCSAASTLVTQPTSGTEFLKTNQSMPAVLPVPTSSFNTLADILTAVPTKELPRAGDTVDASDPNLYKYVVTDVGGLNGSFKVTPGKRIQLWVAGNIDLSDKIIVNQCNAPATPATTPPSLANPSCSPFDVRIYPSGTTTSTLTLNKGTAVCDVFFHLPNYSVTFINNTGTVSTQDCGVTAKTSTSAVSENTGIYWVNSWAGGVSGTSVIDPPRATWSTAISATNLTNATSPLRPLTGPATAWDRQSF
jgi:Tfp pilus assembly protein PilX